MVEKKSSVYATEGKLTAIADAATKREKDRKASLAAAGVKDINAYDNAYAPLKNFEKDVNSLYNEINSLGKHHAASDTQLGNVRKNAEGMVSRIGSINSFLDTYGNLYDKNSIAEMRSGLSEISKGLTGWLDQSGAEDYLTKLNATDTIDTASVAKAIKDKESEIVRAQRGGRDDTKLKEELNAIYEGGGSYGQAAKRRSEYAENKLALEQKKKEAAELGTKIGQSETADEGTASRVQALYAEIKDLEDKISTYEKVIAPSDDAWLEVFGGGNDLSEYKDIEYTAAEDPVRFLSGGKDERKLADTSSTITDDERVVYNYLLKNKGVNAAKAWLRSYAVEDERNQRYGQALGEKYNEIDSRFWRATALVPLSGLVGLEQYATGAASLATPLSSKKPTSALAYAQQEATKDLGKVGKAINDATVAIGNMVPSIAIGAINPVAGKISFGASAAGNAYNEARKEGKSIGEAAMYGLVSGGSELVLQRFLGGIPVLSGGANKLVTAAKNLKNPAIRALSVYGLNALSEGTEEYIQDILDPVFRNVIFQEDNEVKILSEDAAYSFLLGAISAGVLNIPSLARSIPVSRFGNGINVSGHTQNLIDNALKLPVDSEAYDLASKLKSGELKASDENVGEFATAFARDGGDLSFLYERSGTVEEMAQKGNVVAEPIAEVKVEENDERIPEIDKMIEEKKSEKTIISNNQAKDILDSPQLMEELGISVDGITDFADKRRAVKDAVQKYSEKITAQRLANEVAQSTANFAADVQKAKAEQTDANTPSEAPAENATTYRYQYDVDKQRLGTRIIKDLGNTSAGGVKLSERLTEIATSVTGDKDANRAVYKLFANPRYAMMASVEHTEDMRNIIRNIKDSGNSNFARRQMSNYIASTAAITEWTDLIRKDSNGVSLDKAAAMAPSNGKNAPDGYFDESEHAVVLNDGMVTYKRIISTLVHEGFHADGSIDRALVNNFSRYLENKWGKKDWDATVKDKKAKIEAYDGKPTTTVKAEEEVCAQVISELFNKPSAWEAMGEMFGEVEGSDRFVNRMKATVKRIFDNFRKKFGADIPNGKLTTFRDFLDTLLVKTQKGYTSVNETAKAPAKKETKAETKAATETKAQPETAEEIDLEEDVGGGVDEDYYEGLTDEEREAVDLADELLDGETKKTADGGMMYSSEDTEVDLPDSDSHMLSETAESEVKKALADKYYRKEIRLTNRTPSIMLSQKGVNDYPLFMNASHLRENVFTEAEAMQKGLKVDGKIHYHGLGDELFLKVIDKLDDITEAYRGTKNAEKPERREDYFLLISKLKDKDGNTINVPIYINTKAKQNNVFIDVNKVSTVFGREGIRAYIGEQLNKGNLIKIKKRSPQASEWTPLLGADYGMDASSANRIAESSENVNTPDENSKNFSSPDTDVILPNEKDVEIYQENVRLKAENEELKRQFKRTQVKKPKLEEVEHLASEIAEKFGLSEHKANEIRTRLLKEFYVPIANPDKRGFYRTDGGRVSPEQLALNLQSICDDIIESADISAEGVGSGASEEIAEAQEYLKDKKYIGAGEGAVSKLYNDLLVKFPELFPANKHMRTKDKIGRIDQIVHAPTLESAAKSINANASVELQNFLIKQSLEPQAPTYADRVDQRIADIMNKNINRASYYRRLIEQETHEAISAEMEDTHKKAMIVKMALRMTKMLTRPTKKNHIPESLRIEIARALSAIDFHAKKNADGTETKKGATLSDMSAAVRRIAAEAKDDVIIADRASKALENLEAAQDAAVQIGDDYKEVVKALSEYSQELTRMLPDSVIQKMEKSEQRSVARAIVVLEEIEKYGSSKNPNAVEYVLRRLNLNTANILNNANEVMKNYATEYELEYLKERTRKLFDNYKQFDQLSASAVARYLAGSSAIRLVDLSGAALDSVYRAVLTLNKLVAQENNLLSSNILARKNELGKKAYAEVSSKNKTAFKKLLFDTAAGGVAVEQLEPATMFGILGPTFNELFLNVEHGVDKQTQINQDYAEYMAKILKNNGYSKKSLNETYHKFKLADGSELALSVGEMMSIYLTARQQDGVNHLVDGGIDLRPRDNTLGKKVKELVKPRQTTTYRLSEADVNAIISKLDEQQRKFADDISEYLSKDLASELNEVSMRLYGYRMFTNPKYFPLRVSSDTTRKNADAKDPGKKDVQNKSLRNVGATQARKEKAGNRLNITDVFSMADDHVSTMSTWAAYVEPLTDFEAVLNYRVDNGSSVVKALNEAYGYQVTKYYQDFINRVNGAKMGGDENLDKLENKLIGSARAAQTALNWAVILKQPTSYFRAGQYLGVVDLAKGATKNNKAAQKRMLRYSGLARMKELGYSDLTFGKRIGEMYDNSEKTRISNFEEWSAKGAAAADRITWAAIWSACETAVERDPAFGKTRNEEFYAEVNRRFNDVIMDTQVVRTSFTTPPALLKDSVAYKAMYGFKNEPFKQMNMIYRSINEMQSAKDSKDKLAMKTATRHLAGGLIGIALSTMLSNVIDTLAPIFRGWDDEDYIVEEDGEKITFANKLLKEYVNNVIWSSVALIPLGGDLAANIAQGYDAYSTPVGDLVENVKSVWGLYDTIFNEDATPGKRRTASAKAVIETASILGSISAIPTRTIIRDLRGLFTTAFRVFGLDEAEYVALTLTGSPDSAYYQKYIGAMLMECINRKDQEAVDYIVNDLKKNYGWSDKKVQNLIDYYAVRADTVDKILAEMREGKSVMTYDFSKYGTDIMGAAEVIEEYVKDDLAENKNRSAFYNPDLEHMQERYYFPDIKDATKSTIDALVFNRDAIGAEFAVCASGKTIFEKASEAHKKGASFESFLETYLRTRAADSDKDFMGETVSLSKSTEIYDIINEVTKSETERKALYDVFKVSKTTQNEGIMASIVDAAIRKDDAAYEKATQDYFDNNEGAKTSDLNAAKFKYIEAEMMRLAKLSYDDPAKYETEVARYRNGKNSTIAARFTEANMRAARNRWINDYTEELAEKLAKNANDSDKVKLIYAEAAKYGIDKAKLDTRARKYANKK